MRDIAAPAPGNFHLGEKRIPFFINRNLRRGIGLDRGDRREKSSRATADDGDFAGCG